MLYRTCIALAALLATGPAFAWSVECHVDEFTDEESCILIIRDSGSSFTIALTDDGEDLAFGSGDRESFYNDTFLIRVDDNPHRDIEEISTVISPNNRGYVIAVVPAEKGKEIIQEAIEGEELNVRLSEYNGPNQDTTFHTVGLDYDWNHFREKTGF